MPHKEFRLPSVIAMEDATIVENALRQIPGVSQVTFHPETKLVTIQWSDPAQWDDIERKLDVLGYPVIVE